MGLTADNKGVQPMVGVMELTNSGFVLSNALTVLQVSAFGGIMNLAAEGEAAPSQRDQQGDEAGK